MAVSKKERKYTLEEERKLKAMQQEVDIIKRMIKSRMEKANVASLEKLMKDFKELGGKIIACKMAMEIMGVKKEDLRQDLIDDYGAVGTYINEARESKINLFYLGVIYV